MRVLAAFLAISASLFATTSEGVGIDSVPWDKLTKQYVTPESRVDYRAWKAHGIVDLDRYLHQIAQPWPTNMDERARKAALINAYNALTVRWILENYPVASIWRTYHPFRDARHTVNAKRVSLDDVEGQLRAMRDPRIHAALVCASQSCPPLRREAYTGEQLDSQLDDNVRKWLADSNLNQFFPQEHLAEVSKIFDWYRGDFDHVGGVLSFLGTYAPAADRAALHDPNTKVRYKTYHWGLNDTSGLGENYSQAEFYWDWVKNGYLRHE